MSTRERWVVYPLLFFALLSGLKDQFALPADSKHESITCKRLTVEGADGRPLIELRSNIAEQGDQTGLLIMYGAAMQSQTGATQPSKLGQLPRPRTVELGSEQAGGYARIFGSQAAPTIKMGHHESLKKSGVSAEDEGGQPLNARAETEVPWGVMLDWTDLDHSGDD